MNKKAKIRANRLRQQQKIKLQAKAKKPEIKDAIEKLPDTVLDVHKSLVLASAIEILTNEPGLPIDDATIRAHILIKKKLAIKKSNSKEHIKRNMERVKKAEAERGKRGDSLPKRYKVSGGGVSPK